MQHRLVSCRVGLIYDGTVFVFIQEDIRSPGAGGLRPIPQHILCKRKSQDGGTDAACSRPSQSVRGPDLGNGVSRTLLMDRMP